MIETFRVASGGIAKSRRTCAEYVEGIAGACEVVELFQERARCLHLDDATMHMRTIHTHLHHVSHDV